VVLKGGAKTLARGTCPAPGMATRSFGAPAASRNRAVSVAEQLWLRFAAGLYPGAVI
jgi:hypothetical protein